MIKKKILPIILAAALVLSMLPASAFAAGEVCQIGAEKYLTLDAALTAAVSGDTILLLADIVHTTGISISGKSVTFDLDVYDLTVNSAGNGLSVSNGTVSIKGSGTFSLTSTAGNGLDVGSGGVVDITGITGSGAFNVTGSSYGVCAYDGGTAKVTSARSTGDSGVGAYAYGAAVAGHIVVTGSATADGTSGVAACAAGSGSTVSVGADATATGLYSYGARVFDGGEVIVGNDATGASYGAEAMHNGASVKVTRDVISTGNSDGGVHAINTGYVNVGRNVVASGTGSVGIDLSDGGNATIKGTVSAEGTYISLQGTGTAIEGWTSTEEIEEVIYLVYTDASSNKARVTAINSSISPNTADFDKYPDNQQDVITTVTLGSATEVKDVTVGGATIGKDNYSVSGNTLTIMKTYLAQQGLGILNLSVEFDAGAPATLSITISDSVCQIGTTSYHTLEEALADAANGDTIMLLDDITFNSCITVSGETVNIDLNGNDLSVASAGNGLDISAGALNLTGGKLDITADLVGVYAHDGGTAVIDGTISAATYIMAGTTALAQSAGTADGDYLVYTDGTNTVSVKIISASISPATAEFDRNPANAEGYVDITTEITWNSAWQITDVTADGTTIGGENYIVAGNTLTIYKGYLDDQPDEDLNLSVVFNVGSAATLTISVSETVCVIGAAKYTSLADAIDHAVNGDTITLLDDITYNGGITISGKSVTFNLNGFDLNVSNDSGNAVSVDTGTLNISDISGNGTLSAQSSSASGLDVGSDGVVTIAESVTFSATGSYCGVYAHDGGQAKVTSATSTGDAGAYAAGAGSSIEVTADAIGSTYGVHASSGGYVSVGGNATGAGTAGAYAEGTDSSIEVAADATGNTYGVSALSGGRVSVGGNATGTGIAGAYAEGTGSDIEVAVDAIGGSYGVFAYSRGHVSVGRNATGSFIGVQAIDSSQAEVSYDVSSTGDGGYAIFTNGGSTVTVTGSATAGNGNGVYVTDSTVVVGGSVAAVDIGVTAYNGGNATVNGTVTATGAYISLEGITSIPEEGMPGTGDDTLYLMYADTNGNIVRVTNPLVPAVFIFDKNSDNIAENVDVITNIAWKSGATAVTDVFEGGISIGTGNYSVAGNTLKINKAYLMTRAAAADAYEFIVEFNAGVPAKLLVTVIDTRPAVCAIGATEYTTLEEALAKAASGDTITLLQGIEYGSGITVSGMDLNFNLGEYELTVNAAAGNGLNVSGGTLSIAGSGTFSVTAGAGHGLYVGSGGVVNKEESVTFNATGTLSGVYACGGTAQVSSAAATAANGCGAMASAGGSVTVTESVSADQAGSRGVYANGGTVTVNTDVSANGDNCIGVYATGGGSAVVKRNVTATGATVTGVAAYGGSTAKIDGNISVPVSNATYISLEGASKTGAEGKPGADANEGYFVFEDLVNGNTVLVKIKAGAISPESATFNIHPDSQADIKVTVTYNDAQAIEYVMLDGTTIGAENYSVVGDELTITKEYLNALELDTYHLSVVFTIGSPADLTITVMSPSVYLTLIPAGGKLNTPGTGIQTAYGETYDLPKPTRLYYYFCGWYTEAGELIESGNKVEMITDATLTAKWMPNTLLALNRPYLIIKPTNYKTLTLTWNAVLNAEGYEVWKKVDGKYQCIATYDNSTLVHEDKNLTTNVYCYYYIRACHKPYDDTLYSVSYIRYAKPVWPKVYLKAVAASYNSVKLTWNKIAGDNMAYEVQRYVPGTAGYVAITNESTVFEAPAEGYLSYTDTECSTGTLNYYRIRAYDRGSPETVKPESYSPYRYLKPAWPTVYLKAVSNTYNSIKLTWNEVAGAEGYEVYRSTSYRGPYSDPIGTVLQGGGATYTDNNNGAGLTTGRNYYYVIKAYNGANKSPQCRYRYAKPLWPAVRLSAASNTYNSIKLKWNTIAGDGMVYEVQRYVPGTAGYVAITNESTVFEAPSEGYLSYTDTGCSMGTLNYYRIRAYDGESSETVKPETYSPYRYLKPAWPKVYLKAVSASYNSVELTWNKIAGDNMAYEVQRYVPGTAGYVAITNESTVFEAPAEGYLSYTDTECSTGTLNYYRIRAYDRGSPETVKPESYSPYRYLKPAWPTVYLKAVSNTYNSIKLTWNEIAGADGYEVYRSTSYRGPYSVPIGTVLQGGGATYTDNNNEAGLDTGRTYYYVIRAYDVTETGTNRSPQCRYRYAKPLWPKVYLKAVSASYNSVELTWNEIAGATAYEVQRYDGGSYKKIEGADASFDHSTEGYISYVNEGLTPGVTRYYRIRAYDGESSNPEKTGTYSNYRYLKPVPAVPGSVVLQRTSATSINLSWSAVEGATGYEVWRAASLNGRYYAIASTDKLTYDNIGLYASKLYYYKVIAYTKVGTAKVYGSFSGKYWK